MAENTGARLSTSVDRNLISDYKAGLAASSKAQQSGGWLDTAGDIAGQAMSGLAAQREQRQIAEKAKKEELQAYEDQYERNAETITQNAGSLGTEYYNIAYEEAQRLQEQYAEAVKSGDKKLQGDLKGQLNGLSTSVQALKGNLESAQDVIKDNKTGESSLSEGMTVKEKAIVAACTDAKNIRYDNGELKYANPEWDGTENTKQFFTQEDLNNSLILNDTDLSAKIIEHEATFGPAGILYQDGTTGSKSFNAQRATTLNLNYINEKNIASMMHDDMRGTGVDNSFSNNVKEYLDKTDYQSLGLDKIDWDDDGEVGDDDDLMYLEDMDTLHKIITDKTNPLYNFETSRGIIAEWMTMKQKEAFTGTMNPNLKPKANETREEFIERGGSIGALKTAGITWSADKDMFVTQESNTR